MAHGHEYHKGDDPGTKQIKEHGPETRVTPRRIDIIDNSCILATVIRGKGRSGYV